MATAKEIRKLIGKTVRFKSNRTLFWADNDQSSGEVKEQIRSESHIGSDWHNTRSIEIIEILD